MQNNEIWTINILGRIATRLGDNMKQTGLRSRFIFAIGLLFIIIGTLTVVLSLRMSKQIIDGISRDYSKRVLMSHRSGLLLLVDREMALTENLVSSPLLKAWCLNENDPRLKSAALKELENYRLSFRDSNFFFAIKKSGHYYFNSKDDYKEDSLRYTLNPDLLADGWFFDILKGDGTTLLDLDSSVHLGITKIWIDAPIRMNGHNIGVAGTGLDLTSFLETLIDGKDKSASTILFDDLGNIKVHRNIQYMKKNSEDKTGNNMITIADLAHSDRDRGNLKSAMKRVKAHPGRMTTFDVTLEGKHQIASMMYLKELGWYALVVVNGGSFLGIGSFVPVLAILLAALLVVSLATAFLVNKMVLKPLSKLVSFSQTMAQGDYSVRIEPGSNDEIGFLTNSLGQMAATIDDYTKHLEDMVTERTAELRQSNKAMTDSIMYAKLIQSSMMPSPELMKESFSDFFTIWRPRNTVGGDVYVVEPLDDTVAISVMDCTGHGVPGAFMSMAANAVLKELLRKYSDRPDPARILTEMNKSLKHILHHNLEEDTDNGVDMGLVIYRPATDSLTFSGARISLFAYKAGTVTELKGDTHSLGYRNSNSEYRYTNQTIENASEHLYYLATDGIIDQPGGQRGFCLGKKGLVNYISQHGDLPLEEQKSALENMLEEYMDTAQQRDDITVLGFRFRWGKEAFFE